MSSRIVRFTISAAGLLLGAPLSAQTTALVDVASGGVQGNSGCGDASISDDGRYVAFVSLATNLVAGDTNGRVDIFVRDRVSGTTERVNVDSTGLQANDDSDVPRISGDGRYVAFESTATNLVPGDTNGRSDIFVHDRVSGATERVSVSSGGVQANHWSFFPSISSDGRYVAFHSTASNLVAGDTNGTFDVFVRDRVAGTTERASVDSFGAEGFGTSDHASISGDGRYVAFESGAILDPGDTSPVADIYVHDRVSGTTDRASVDSGGSEANSISGNASISGDGRYVAYYSVATNLVAGDTNGAPDIFVRDRVANTTERVSVDSGGAQSNGTGSYLPSISGDGNRVAFESLATNLVAGDTNGWRDIFVRDRAAGTTVRVSVHSGGGQGNRDSVGASISSDGDHVAFSSQATTLVQGDANGMIYDIFVHDRLGGPSFTSLCDPGAGGVIGCPCSNAPSGSGRGCDNSAATGGATLSASGATYLSSDSLVFTTSGGKPTALSVLFQATTSVPAGVVYGQGVRCAGGTLKRLFSKNASGGSITAPNFGAGDPTVSARSAAKGDPIPAGGTRYYFVTYRDPVVLGGCPSGSTFNATQTGLVVWSP